MTWSLKTLYQKSSQRTRRLSYATPTTATNREHWIAIYVDEIGNYFDPYGLQPEHVEFTNFMNEHCSEWSPNDRILQSPISTVCGQYCIAFLMFRCRKVSMHDFTSLFTTDLVANDCRVFDWLGALNKN